MPRRERQPARGPGGAADRPSARLPLQRGRDRARQRRDLSPADRGLPGREGVMSKRYHVLLTRDDGGAWGVAFGDYDRTTVDEERADYRDHDWRARDLKIITTVDRQ